MQPNRRSNPSVASFESSSSRARKYFGWLLARREYAASELTSKAKQKGYEQQHIDEALEFLQTHGLQDDNRYAGMKARQSAPRWGNNRIAQVLKFKKVDDEIVQAQLLELPHESERAWHVIERYEHDEWTPELHQKAWRRLATRGFGTATIKFALKRLRSKDASDGVDDR